MPKIEKPDEGYFDLYREYAKTLRAWLVGFGVGTPAIFFTQEKIRDVIVIAPGHGWLISLYLTGVAFQVCIALINKWISWYVYLCQTQGNVHSDIFAICERYSKNMTVDVVADIASVMCFAAATIWTAALFI
jgi:hypothetical protein